MKAIPKEIREKIIEHKTNKEKNKDIGKWLGISESAINRIWNKYKVSGTIENNYKNSGRKSAVSSEKMELVENKIKEQPDITLQELVDMLELNISISALSRKLKKLEYTLKKRLYFRKHN